MQWKSNKLTDLRKQYAGELYPLYGKREADAMLDLLIERYFGISRAGLALDRDIRLSESEILKLHFAVKELKRQKPIQYILKYVDFSGVRIMVNESVLIPRPETEELVKLIIEREGNKTGSAIDMGTGSGCIAIALAKNLKGFEITGVDISPGALSTAGKNSFVNEVKVDFRKFDILNPESDNDLGQFDVIVSNPPYVTQSEKALMKSNVLDYEPHLALFVEDDDPLVFYRAIIYFAGDHLKPGGRVYFEINENLGEQVRSLLVTGNYQQVELHKDIHGKQRFVSGIKG